MATKSITLLSEYKIEVGWFASCNSVSVKARIDVPSGCTINSVKINMWAKQETFPAGRSIQNTYVNDEFVNDQIIDGILYPDGIGWTIDITNKYVPGENIFKFEACRFELGITQGFSHYVTAVLVIDYSGTEPGLESEGIFTGEMGAVISAMVNFMQYMMQYIIMIMVLGVLIRTFRRERR